MTVYTATQYSKPYLVAQCCPVWLAFHRPFHYLACFARGLRINGV